MNVKLAVQVLSMPTAKTVDYFGQNGLLHSHDCKPTSQFISLTDSWFDLFNSRVRIDDQKHSRDAYGISLEQQNRVLETMTATMECMSVWKKSHVSISERGGNLFQVVTTTV